MKILIIGSGGREHALAWAAAKSPLSDKIYIAPGNAGTASCGENVNIKVEDSEGLLAFAKENNIGLTIVGPEIPLVNGLVDMFEAEGLKVFGPDEAGAQLEGSKIFTKNLLKKNNIPTADFGEFDSPAEAKEYIRKNKKYPMVVKADGLAAGKGVIICADEKEALAAVEEIMEKKAFKEAGDRLVVEEFLEGEEASILALTDGKTIAPLVPAQDHKRIFDDDKGPNTGGMGAYAPAPLITPEIMKEVTEKILYPTLTGLKREGITYKGVLYAGLMMTKEGAKVLEYNCRFGDPETQCVMPLFKSDIVSHFLACAEGRLDQEKVEFIDAAAINVVLASKGYPGDYEKGKEITGLDSFSGDSSMIVFHAGTKEEQGKTVTAGGRVLNVTCVEKDIKSAIIKLYSVIDKVAFEGVQYRKDIGKKAQKYKGY